MNRSEKESPYLRYLRQYYFELAGSDGEPGSDLDLLLENVMALPSPEREEQFVEGVYRQSELENKRVA